jgi:hypothetical protein
MKSQVARALCTRKEETTSKTGLLCCRYFVRAPLNSTMIVICGRTRNTLAFTLSSTIVRAATAKEEFGTTQCRVFALAIAGTALAAIHGRLLLLLIGAIITIVGAGATKTVHRAAQIRIGAIAVADPAVSAEIIVAAAGRSNGTTMLVANAAPAKRGTANKG